MIEAQNLIRIICMVFSTIAYNDHLPFDYTGTRNFTSRFTTPQHHPHMSVKQNSLSLPSD